MNPGGDAEPFGGAEITQHLFAGSIAIDRARVELVVAKFQDGAKHCVCGRSVMNPGSVSAVAERHGAEGDVSRHSPDSRPVGPDLPSLGGRGNEIRSQPTRRQPKRQDARPHWAETRCFVFIKAYLCRRRLSHLTSSPGHAGAGGARSWALNIRISWNICPATATSAIRKLVERSWL